MMNTMPPLGLELAIWGRELKSDNLTHTLTHTHRDAQSHIQSSTPSQHHLQGDSASHQGDNASQHHPQGDPPVTPLHHLPHTTDKLLMSGAVYAQRLSGNSVQCTVHTDSESLSRTSASFPCSVGGKESGLVSTVCAYMATHSPNNLWETYKCTGGIHSYLTQTHACFSVESISASFDRSGDTVWSKYAVTCNSWIVLFLSDLSCTIIICTRIIYELPAWGPMLLTFSCCTGSLGWGNKSNVQGRKTCYCSNHLTSY